MEDSRDALIKMVDENIKKHGRMVLSIMGTPGSNREYPYAYSIGHAEKGNPELMLTSLGGDTATYLVNAAANELAKRNWKVEAEDRIQLENVAIRFIAAPGFEDEARGAQHRARTKNAQNLSFLQILWPDTSGLFPDEEGYDHLTFPQPIWQHEQEKVRNGIN